MELIRSVSILSDSISTFEGYNPKGYSVFYNREMQIQNGIQSVSDTWWYKVLNELHAYLCVNNSYSGSKVSGKKFPAAYCDERLRNLRTKDHEPNTILVYIGHNDFGYGVKPTQRMRALRKLDPLIFEDAYEIMLRKIKMYYPHSSVVCATLMKTRIQNDATWVFPERFAGELQDDYNKVIRRQAKRNNCFLADLASYNTTYETLDGSHPTRLGHEEIADIWLRCLKNDRM